MYVACQVYAKEGSLNKMLVDDKGLLFLCTCGLPPFSHADDPLRAVQIAMELCKALPKLSGSARPRRPPLAALPCLALHPRALAM